MNDTGPSVRRKVYAYITHGERLLVFTQPAFPEAGVQPPGGTLEPNETPREGVLREAFEETGLADLEVVRLLGERWFEHPDLNQRHHRSFFHLRCLGDPPEEWDHLELHQATGDPTPIRFSFRWWPLAQGLPDLVAGFGALLPELMASLDREP